MEFPACFSSLSERAKHTFQDNDFMVEKLAVCRGNPFDPEDNPKGMVNLGTAVDKLMEPELQERLNAKDMFHFRSSDHQHYFDFRGKSSTRVALANFFNRYFNVAEEVSPENLVVLGGTASCLDSLSFALFDPGDVYITPTPAYKRIYTDLNNRSLAQPCPLELPEKPDAEGRTFVLSPKILEEKILQLRKEKKNVRGFLLINPQNPLGDVYSSDLVLSLLKICAKYELHAIFDEVYALSLHTPGAEMGSSVLSILDLPDPERTHFVWALTKDFGLAGLRLGVIHSVNKSLLKVLEDVAIYCPCPSINQDTATTLINDTEWLDEVYFPLRRKRLHDRYHLMKSRLEEIGIPVRPSEAGLFVWCDLRKFLSKQTLEAELGEIRSYWIESLKRLPFITKRLLSPALVGRSQPSINNRSTRVLPLFGIGEYKPLIFPFFLSYLTNVGPECLLVVHIIHRHPRRN